MSNAVSFVGRLTRDAEIKDVGSHQVTAFSVANDTGFGDKKVTNFFNCSMWGARGQKLLEYLQKGKQVFITGELSLKKYAKDGVEKLSPNVNVGQIEFIKSSSEGQSQTQGDTTGTSNDDEDDLPF